MSTSNIIHKHNTRLSTGVLKRKIKNINDDNNSDDSNDFNDSDDSEESIESEDDNMSKLEYYKFLNKLYPSKHSKEKLNSQKQIEKFKFNFANDNQTLNNGEEKLYQLSKKYYKKKNLKHQNKKNKSQEHENNYDNDTNHIRNSDNSDDNDDNDDSDDNYDSDNEIDSNKKQFLNGLNHLFKGEDTKKNINIIVNLKDGENNIYNYENSSNNDQDMVLQLDEQLLNSDTDSDTDNKSEENEIIEKEPQSIKSDKKTSNKNYKEFVKIMENEDDNESKYFKQNMSVKEQSNTIEKLKHIKTLTTIEKPYLIHLLELDIPDIYKACALKKLNTLRSMGGGHGSNSEYYKIKSWVDAFIKIPFNKYNNLPITFSDGIDKCHQFMENAKQILDSVTYGLEDAKIQIMQMIGLWLVNPNAIGTAIAIKGPPGTGKTTLIKDGISKILNRPFAMVALGGCGDSGFLDGHDYTYEGSKYGKIIDILIQADCMNPVILFDELDKISDSSKGAEITGVLTHLTDTTQNSKFSDKYLSEISLDMSRALYIFSYNDERLVNPILKDRMYKIETKGYKINDKKIIANKYLLPKIREQSKFNETDIVISDESLEYIINKFTDNEAGVRNLKRSLEIIYTKMNLYRLLKPDTDLFNNENMINKTKINFPINVDQEIIDKLLIKPETDKIPFGMYN